ncbi:MAG: phosphatase PAP2 family protein [Streptosporangiaceae bacterium]
METAQVRQSLTHILRDHRTWACLLLLAGFCAVTADVLLHGPLTRLDWNAHTWIGGHVEGPWWWLFYVLAQAGREAVLTVPLAVVSLVAAFRHRSPRPLVLAFVVCVSLVIIVPGIKILVGRTAPGSGVDLVFTMGREFPSGHATNAIMICGAFLELLVSLHPRVASALTVRRRRALVVLATAAAGVGMIGLDYHWITDALAGWLLGAAMYIPLIALDPFRPLRISAGIEPGRGSRPQPAAPRPPPNRRGHAYDATRR